LLDLHLHVYIQEVPINIEVFESDKVKPKTTKEVFVTSPLTTQH